MSSVHWGCGEIDATYGAQRASRSRSLVDYLARLDWCQNVKAKEVCSARSPGTLLAQQRGCLSTMSTPPGYAPDVRLMYASIGGLGDIVEECIVV